MLESICSLLLLVAGAALTPAKTWFAPAQPITVNVTAEGDATLVLTDFAGKVFEPKGSADVSGEKSVDLKEIFSQLSQPGTYILYQAKKGSQNPTAEFVGTPLVIEVRQHGREDLRRGAPGGPMVIKVEPLRYALMKTERGDITMAFYYDVAPNHVDSFLSLAAGGYFDGLTFHRIIPEFVIQGGDPLGDGTGGPGYQIDAEFNERPHDEGILSMARSQNPNSAGSQFFICLTRDRTKALDNSYTVFGKVTDGIGAVKAIAATKLTDPDAGRPEKAPVIQKVEVRPVTAQENPYAALLKPKDAGAAGAAPAPAPK